MKKVLIAVSFLLALSVMVSSCDKSGTDNGEEEDNPLVGCWILEGDVFDGSRVYNYYEFTNTGLIKEYWDQDADYRHFNEKIYATFKGGVLSFPGEWYLDDIYKYWIEDGVLYVDDEGIEIFEFSMENRDRFYLVDGNERGYFNRIKSFSK